MWLDALNLARKSRRHVFELGNASTGYFVGIWFDACLHG